MFRAAGVQKDELKRWKLEDGMLDSLEQCGLQPGDFSKRLFPIGDDGLT